MKINISYDASAASAPVGFVSAVSAAVRFYETTFINNITLNLSFAWASTGGSSISESQQTASYNQSYATVVGALKASASSASDLSSVAALPAANPFTGQYFVDTAESKALGLANPNGAGLDGTVTLNPSFSYTFDQNNRAVAGQYDAVGALEHEISEDMGRSMGSDGSLFLEPLALFRYAAPGVIDTSSSAAGASFSADGRTLSSPLGEQGSDLADWGPSVQGDSYGYLDQGKASTVSGTDVQLMDVLGYKVFDPYQYIASYSDLTKAFGDNANAGTVHWQTFGYDEGRTTTFDGLNYIASYADLVHAFGANADAGAVHFIDFGSHEGRTTTFDGLDYIASYKDLIQAFGASNDAGATHYIDYGANEGRATSFDGLAYIAQYSDLMKAFGSNNDAGATHYINFGLNEGRSTQFNVAAYENAHPDLVGKYATNDQFLTAYINQYHNTGTVLT